VTQDRRGPETASALAFFGSMTASMSHDLNNVVAIIHQVNGLLADLCVGMEAGRTPAPDRLKSVQERIDRQVARGGALIKRLNRFAHSVDDPHVTFDLKALAEEFGALCGRRCERHNMALAIESPEAPLNITSAPFLLLMMLSSALDRYLVDAEEGDRVQLSLVPDGDGVRLDFEGRSGSPAPSQWIAEFDSLSRALDGRWTEDEQQSALTLSIMLPVSGMDTRS